MNLLSIAERIVALINSRPRSPTPEEIRTVVRDGFLDVFVAVKPPEMSIDRCRELVDSKPDHFLRLANSILALINSKPTSPTVEEIRLVLRVGGVPTLSAADRWKKARKITLSRISL